MAEAEAERLYGLPLEEFTAARDELARRLRSDGQREEASRVASLRKPVLAAWVVNRLVRAERDQTQRLLDAAEGIKAGRSGADESFREALERLTAAARELLEREGRSPDDVVQQVASTLRAGAASEPELLASGTLTRPIEASGFGAMAGAAVAPSRRRAPSKDEKAPKPRVDRKRVEAALRALSEARDEARRLQREATEADRRAREAREDADAARERVAEAEARFVEARGG